MEVFLSYSQQVQCHMEYEWIFEEGVVYDYSFLGFYVVVVFYHAGDINRRLGNEA